MPEVIVPGCDCMTCNRARERSSSAYEVSVRVRDMPGAERCWRCWDVWVPGENHPELEQHGTWERVQGAPYAPTCRRCYEYCPQCERCARRAYQLYNTVTGLGLCNDCIRPYTYCCNHCGLYSRREMETVGYDRVCDSCLSDDYHGCDGCGQWVRDGYDCDSCYSDDDDDERSSDHIHYYSYKPNPRFHGTSESKLFMGMELELNRAGYRCAEIANGHLGDLGYLKDDSSLDSGFEIVTHPMTHEYARTEFPWEMLRELRNEGARPGDAGLHVHVSRDAFSSPSHVYRWMKLIYRNEDPVCGIARRQGSTWAKFNETARKGVKEHCKGGTRGDRYSAINCQNYTTFEMRIFASSLDRQEVMAALDLVAASVEYTRNLTIPVILSGGWDWEAFKIWVSERDEYAALAAEMEN